MISSKTILDYINQFAPLSTMPDWDNSGFLIGDIDKAVSKVAICLDVKAQTIDQAIKQGAELIISHHPIMFDGVKQIASSSREYKLIRAGIALIAIHMPLDYLPDGPNQILCEKLGLKQVGLINERTADKFIICDGVIGQMDTPMNAEQFAVLASEKLCSAVRYSDSGNLIHRIGICGGAGGFLVESAKAQGCDALLSGEFKHHELLQAEEIGLTVFDGGHFATESHIPEVLLNKLVSAFPELKFFISSETSPCDKWIVPKQ